MDAFQFFANRTLPYPTCHAESIYIRPLDSYEMTTNRKSWKHHHITVWTISFRTFAIRIIHTIMTTLTLKINERSKAGKAFLEFAKNFFQDNTSVTVVEEESPYNPEFVEMVLDSYKNDKRTVVVNPNDIWESLGLK